MWLALLALSGTPFLIKQSLEPFTFDNPERLYVQHGHVLRQREEGSVGMGVGRMDLEVAESSWTFVGVDSTPLRHILADMRGAPWATHRGGMGLSLIHI